MGPYGGPQDRPPPWDGFDRPGGGPHYPPGFARDNSPRDWCVQPLSPPFKFLSNCSHLLTRSPLRAPSPSFPRDRGRGPPLPAMPPPRSPRGMFPQQGMLGHGGRPRGGGHGSPRHGSPRLDDDDDREQGEIGYEPYDDRDRGTWVRRLFPSHSFSWHNLLRPPGLSLSLPPSSRLHTALPVMTL